jgi:chromate transporter
VILNLSLWFGAHVIFGHVRELRLGPVKLLLPSLSSVDPAATLLAALALLAIFRFKLGLAKTLAASAVLGMLWRLLASP